MPAAHKLQRLAGYLSSETVDINKAGQIVGNSLDDSQPSFAPPSPSTLWAGNTISSYRKPEPEMLMPHSLARETNCGRAIRSAL